MRNNPWKEKLEAEFSGDTDADIRMLKNLIADAEYWVEGPQIISAARIWIAILTARQEQEEHLQHG